MGMAEENEEHSCCAGSNTAATISDHMICLVGADRMEAGANLLGGEESIVAASTNSLVGILNEFGMWPGRP